MKRRNITGLVVMATAFILSALGASSAQAGCFLVVVGGSGNFDAGCHGVDQHGKQWVRAVPDLSYGINKDLFCGLLLLPLLLQNVLNSFENLGDCKNERNPGPNKRWIKIEVPLTKGGIAKPEFKRLPTGTKFTSDSSPSRLEAGGNLIECKSGTNTGEITSMDSVGKLVIKFTGCEGEGSGKTTKCPVNSPGAAAGELVTKTLKGLLGTVKSSEAESEVGLLIEPETTKKFMLINKAEECSLPETVVTGSVAGEVSPVSTLGLFGDINLVISGEQQLIQGISVLSGTVKPKLEAYGVSAKEQVYDEVQFEGQVEVV